MIVEQIWTGNAYRNFNYLIACPDSGEAMAVDPLDHEKCLARARDKGWEITQILNTHEHGDHTGGNRAMVAATGAKLLAHANARDTIPGVDVGLSAGDVIKIGLVGCGCNPQIPTGDVEPTDDRTEPPPTGDTGPPPRCPSLTAEANRFRLVDPPLAPP